MAIVGYHLGRDNATLGVCGVGGKGGGRDAKERALILRT
jgi:hypothetical protein